MTVRGPKETFFLCDRCRNAKPGQLALLREASSKCHLSQQLTILFMRAGRRDSFSSHPSPTERPVTVMCCDIGSRLLFVLYQLLNIAMNLGKQRPVIISYRG